MVNFGESEEGLGYGRVMRVRYEVDVKLEHLMKRLSLELPLGECVLTGNMFSEEAYWRVIRKIDNIVKMISTSKNREINRNREKIDN